MDYKYFFKTVCLKDEHPPVIKGLKAGDTGNVFGLTIVDRYPCDLTGCDIITAIVKMPDGSENAFSYPESENFLSLRMEDGYIEFMLPPACVVQTGVHFMSVVLTKDSANVVVNINYHVQSSETGDDEAIVDNDNYPVLLELISKISQMMGEHESIKRDFVTMMDDIDTWYNAFVKSLQEFGHVNLSSFTTKKYVDERPVYTVGKGAPTEETDKARFYVDEDSSVAYYYNNGWREITATAVFG